LCILYDKNDNKQENAELKTDTSDVIMINSLTDDNLATVENNETVQPEESSNQSTVSVEDQGKDTEIHPSYDVLCSEDNELLRKLKQFSESIYKHSIQIGDLSCRAAIVIGADEFLAKAGGLYHEIGKLGGKNYIEEGLAIAEEYSFPKELKAILKEHNIKYDKPSSVESVIVMLSDNIVSTIDYINKTEEHKYSTSKMIENIFQMRMDKGTFDGVNLSLKDFKVLKEFYEKEFSR
jgi:putative nucleotidyltransferase with HDIG domain